jgi:hypothetical protein
LSKNPRDILIATTQRAVKDQRLLQLADSVTDPLEKTLCLPFGPKLLVRELGDRDLYDVPMSEIKELARLLGLSDGSIETIARGILDSYGIKRLTVQAQEHIAFALYVYSHVAPGS